jgi:hypothetical protein
MIYRTRGEHANHYQTNAVYMLRIKCGKLVSQTDYLMDTDNTYRPLYPSYFNFFLSQNDVMPLAKLS